MAYIQLKWLVTSCASFSLQLITSCEGYAWVCIQAESVFTKAVS